jgi:large subunit ribosomal protein L32
MSTNNEARRLRPLIGILSSATPEWKLPPSCLAIVAMVVLGLCHLAPKKKKSKAKSRHHRAAACALEPAARNICPHCQSVKVPHVVCPNCGWYKGRQAVEVD